MDIYDNDNLVKKISRENSEYKLPESAKNEKGEEVLLNNFAHILETNEHIFVWHASEIKDYVLGENRYLDIYDKQDCKFLGTTTIKEKGIPHGIRNDKIFFDDFESDFPKVVRYRFSTGGHNT